MNWCDNNCDVVEFAAFGLAALSLLVLWQTLKQLRVSSETQSRAYVAIKDGRITRFSPPKPKSSTPVLVYLIRLENVGQTPAQRLTAATNIFAAEEPDVENWRNMTRDSAEESLGPTHLRELETEITARTWARLQDELKGMSKGKLFFFGYADYFDVFGKRHFTEFCLQPPTGWNNGPCVLLMSDRGNSAGLMSDRGNSAG
ncbi:hypothetical protein CO731_03414 [Aminobacter sp. MSH1]|nr:hypothetical protein CO731_03414 [Aminobacter sp. MSH1]